MREPRKYVDLLFMRRRRILPKRVLFLGEYYGINTVGGKRNGVKIIGQEMSFTLSEMTHKNFDEYYSMWYRKSVRKIYQDSMGRWISAMQALGYNIEMPRIKIYKMRRAWGRCFYTKGVVTLSLYLGLMPRQCIDYVTLHELCHFLVHTHSREFYAVMTNIDPEWKAKEQRLREFVVTHKIF